MTLETSPQANTWRRGNAFLTALAKHHFDACWDAEGVDFDLIDERLLTFDRGRATQKAAFLGELFIADARADPQGTIFRKFFQMDRDGRPKGILVVDLKDFP